MFHASLNGFDEDRDKEKEMFAVPVMGSPHSMQMRTFASRAREDRYARQRKRAKKRSRTTVIDAEYESRRRGSRMTSMTQVEMDHEHDSYQRSSREREMDSLTSGSAAYLRK